MSLARATKRLQFSPARLTCAATLLVCKRCSTGAALRREMKTAVKVAGRKRDLRVVGCGCLDICPKRGSAAIIARFDMPARCIVIDGSATADATFVEELLNEGVGDAVAD